MRWDVETTQAGLCHPLKITPSNLQKEAVISYFEVENWIEGRLFSLFWSVKSKMKSLLMKLWGLISILVSISLLYKIIHPSFYLLTCSDQMFPHQTLFLVNLTKFIYLLFEWAQIQYEKLWCTNFNLNENFFLNICVESITNMWNQAWNFEYNFLSSWNI